LTDLDLSFASFCLRTFVTYFASDPEKHDTKPIQLSLEYRTNIPLPALRPEGQADSSKMRASTASLVSASLLLGQASAALPPIIMKVGAH
jgi:hypothetical protein